MIKRIAIEEHFSTPEMLDRMRSRKEFPRHEIIEDEQHNKIEWQWRTAVSRQKVNPAKTSVFYDLGEGRLKAMDEAGIDMQVLSLSAGVDIFDGREAVEVAQKINDRIAGIIKKYPQRFAAFATLPGQDPEEAALELKRTVKELGFKGSMINSHVRGEYLDNEKYWPIFEMAEKLDVPIYLHPNQPPPDMIKPFLTYPALAGPVWGYAADCGLHAMRLICSGVFDKYPGLKIILGHLGEALPFWLERLDNRWTNLRVASDFPLPRQLKQLPSYYIKNNFYVTTSGMWSQPAFLCTYLALGADRILFAVDYPYESNKEAVQFMDTIQISDSDKEKIMYLNACKLLKL